MIAPEIIKQMILVKAVAEFVANRIRAVAELLLPLGAPIATAVGRSPRFSTRPCRLSEAKSRFSPRESRRSDLASVRLSMRSARLSAIEPSPARSAAALARSPN
jgi:hypothetical protein